MVKLKSSLGFTVTTMTWLTRCEISVSQITMYMFRLSYLQFGSFLIDDLTRRRPQVEQEMSTLPGHTSSPLLVFVLVVFMVFNVVKFHVFMF